MSEAKDWNKLTIAMLKQELANRNLDVMGKKSDLISRLEKSEHGKIFMLFIIDRSGFLKVK